MTSFGTGEPKGKAGSQEDTPTESKVGVTFPLRFSYGKKISLHADVPCDATQFYRAQVLGASRYTILKREGIRFALLASNT